MSKRDNAYFSRSNEILTSEKGLVKLLLLLGVAQFVPIFGTLGVQGYALEHARLVAWGSDAAPKRKGVRVGNCIKSGWRGFVAGAGYVIAASLLNMLLSSLLGDGALTNLLTLAIGLLSGVIYAVAGLRATIYQSFTAGYRLDRMWDMSSEDPEGLCIIGLINVGLSLVLGIAVGFIALLLMVPVFINIFSASNAYVASADTQLIADQLLASMGSVIPWLLLVIYLTLVVGSYVNLIVYTAVGLWMRNFNVQAWGASEDPLPEHSFLERQEPSDVPSQQFYYTGANVASVPTQTVPSQQEPVASTPVPQELPAQAPVTQEPVVLVDTEAVVTDVEKDVEKDVEPCEEAPAPESIQPTQDEEPTESVQVDTIKQDDEKVGESESPAQEEEKDSPVEQDSPVEKESAEQDGEKPSEDEE